MGEIVSQSDEKPHLEELNMNLNRTLGVDGMSEEDEEDQYEEDEDSEDRIIEKKDDEED